jgi:dihydroorotate dehydrogenase
MMTTCEFLAKIDVPVRKFIVSRMPYVACLVYSFARKKFLDRLTRETTQKITLPSDLGLKLWNIKFASPLFNAAGMFKEGEGYELAYRQGAGSFLAGTVTPQPRWGNAKYGVVHPFLAYPRSKTSLNWLGLPNSGAGAIAQKINSINKHKDFPIGVSIASDGEEPKSMEELIQTFKLFERSQVDYIELNESCPNVDHEGRQLNILDNNFIGRLEFISKNFLKKRNRNLPVIVKLSNDFTLANIPRLLDLLLDLEFDGINFGNTSTDYESARQIIVDSELKSYNFFVDSFGGGIAGNPLKSKSLSLTKESSNYLRTKHPNREFHIIRTGGIENYQDYEESRANGVILHQWFTGYFENFARFGHRLYAKFFAT